MCYKLCRIQIRRLSTLKMFQNVCLGGTFDRLHAGHEKLLSEAASKCRKRLTVGVTDETMITKKVLPELICPTDVRIEGVRAFLSSLKPSLELNIVPISDPFGPAITDESLQMKPLEIHLIDLVEDENRQSDEEEDKVSSSSQRMRLLGTELRPPAKVWDSSKGPYLIGLVGGSASGKTSIGKWFEKLGAGVIDCDKLGHEAYEPGSDCYKKVVAEFDRGDLLDADGKIIRSVLAQKVFQSPENLGKLEQMVWPEIWRLTMERAEVMFKSGIKVVILDAAVLLKAGWHKDMHQIFACVIDRDEAIQRIVDRDQKSVEEATQRLNSQTSNKDLVEMANVVFCSKWAYEFTQAQVDKAWSNLQIYINT